MPESKIIAIVGGTGAQGGGLVQAILADPSGGFSPRVVTRNAASAKAAALAALGADIVVADLDRAEEVVRAFDGAYGAFCVTNFFEHFSADQEMAQARNLAEAAKKAGVAHAIWSTLDDTRAWMPLSDDRMPTLQGKYKVPHFDGKGEANAYFAELGVPTTYLYGSFYWDNFIYLGSGPTRGPDGKLALALPLGTAKLAGIASKDMGGCAYGVFKKGEALLGDSVGIAGGHHTGDELAAALSRALREPVVYNAIPPAVYRGFDFPGADDIGNMFQFFQDFEEDFLTSRDIERSRELSPSLQSLEEWLDEKGDEIPLD